MKLPPPSTVPIINVSHVSKKYRLGALGGTTLRDELCRRWAKYRNNADPILRADEAYMHYGEEFFALNDVSFSVKRGERVGIIGSNGAGKSTLLKLVSQITAPTEGEIGLNGRVATMLEVGTGFHGELTGRENIYLNGSILGMKRDEIDAKIEDIIEFSEIREFIDTPVKRYSSGMFVKLAFSVAAHLDAEVLIMDEVLAVGDVAFQKKCVRKMNEISNSETRTILYVSHNISSIRSLCTRCIVLEKGRLVYDGDVEKAISLYAGTDGLSLQEALFHTKKRDGFRIDGKLTVDSLKLIENNCAFFTYNQIVRAEFSFTCTECLKNVYFRLPVFTDVGTRIGTVHTEILPEVNAGVRKVTYMLQFRNLLPGKYSFWIIARSDNLIDPAYDHDVVSEAVMFEVSASKGVSLIPEEQYESWGPLNFPTAEVAEKL